MQSQTGIRSASVGTVDKLITLFEVFHQGLKLRIDRNQRFEHGLLVTRQDPLPMGMGSSSPWFGVPRVALDLFYSDEICAP